MYSDKKQHKVSFPSFLSLWGDAQKYILWKPPIHLFNSASKCLCLCVCEVGTEWKLSKACPHVIFVLVRRNDIAGEENAEQIMISSDPSFPSFCNPLMHSSTEHKYPFTSVPLSCCCVCLAAGTNYPFSLLSAHKTRVLLTSLTVFPPLAGLRGNVITWYVVMYVEGEIKEYVE